MASSADHARTEYRICKAAADAYRIQDRRIRAHVKSEGKMSNMYGYTISLALPSSDHITSHSLTYQPEGLSPVLSVFICIRLGSYFNSNIRPHVLFLQYTLQNSISRYANTFSVSHSPTIVEKHSLHSRKNSSLPYFIVSTSQRIKGTNQIHRIKTKKQNNALFITGTSGTVCYNYMPRCPVVKPAVFVIAVLTHEPVVHRLGPSSMMPSLTSRPRR